MSLSKSHASVSSPAIIDAAWPMAFIPGVIDARRPPIEGAPVTCPSLSHRGLLHSIRNQVAAGAFEDTRAGGPTWRKILIKPRIG